MSTRAVVYLHDANEDACKVNYTMKLYHHYDWYIEHWLWEELVEMLKKVKELKSWSNSWDLRDLFEQLAQVGWFEPTCFNHTDTEYVYHITYELNRTDWFNYKLYVQCTSDDWMEALKNRPKYLMCWYWDWMSKEYNREECKKALYDD